MERKILTEIKGPGARATYNVLARAGFRRSHRYAYRPYCPQCNSCVPIRVQVEGFEPSRSMRRPCRAVGFHPLRHRLVIFPVQAVRASSCDENTDRFRISVALKVHAADPVTPNKLPA